MSVPCVPMTSLGRSGIQVSRLADQLTADERDRPAAVGLRR